MIVYSLLHPVVSIRTLWYIAMAVSDTIPDIATFTWRYARARAADINETGQSFICSCLRMEWLLHGFVPFPSVTPAVVGLYARSIEKSNIEKKTAYAK